MQENSKPESPNSYNGGSIVEDGLDTAGNKYLMDWLDKVDLFPDRISVRHGETVLTAAELRQRAIDLVDRIGSAEGLAADLAIVLNRSEHLIIAIVAAALLGARTTLLSPTMWRRELEGATSGKTVITEPELVPRFDIAIAVEPHGVEHQRSSYVSTGERPTNRKEAIFLTGREQDPIGAASLTDCIRAACDLGFPIRRIALTAEPTTQLFLYTLWMGLAAGAEVNLLHPIAGQPGTLLEKMSIGSSKEEKLSLFLTPIELESLLKNNIRLKNVASGLVVFGTGLDLAYSRAVSEFALDSVALLMLTSADVDSYCVAPVIGAYSDLTLAVYECDNQPELSILDNEGNQVAEGQVGFAHLRASSGRQIPTGATAFLTEGSRAGIFVSNGWHRDHIRETPRTVAIEQWSELLKGLAPCSELPVDRSRPPVQERRYARIEEVVPADLAEALTGFASTLRVTEEAICLAALGVVLQRYNRGQTAAIGAVVSRHPMLAPGSAGGIFDEMIPVPAGNHGETTFASLVQRISDYVADADNRLFPTGELVERLGLTPSASHGPIAQVLFTRLKHKPLEADDEATLGGLMPMGIHGLVHGDIALALVGTSRDLELRLTYNTTLFDKLSAARILSHVVNALKAGLRMPHEQTGEIDIISAGERHLLMTEWGDTRAAATDRQGVIQRIADQCLRTPNATALIGSDGVLTYSDLKSATDALASEIRNSGAAPGTVVGVHLGRSIVTVIALVGILKAGCAYLPLDPDYPSERLAFMVQDSEATVVVTDNEYEETANRLCKTVINLSSLSARECGDQPSAPVDSEALAYLIYTSGSTGKPKGVRITNRNLAAFLSAMDIKFGDEHPGSWLAVTSISFDISVLELLWTLTQGYKVVIASEQNMRPDLSIAEDCTPAESVKKLDLSLYFFGNARADREGTESHYRFVFQAAQFADKNGFTAIWTPERHFHVFGGLYPNPSVLSAALASTTNRIAIRAGSVVLPLHDPIRVTEEWSLVDNLSNGRVGISFASGWQPDDFVLAPKSYEDRKEKMIAGIEEIRKLWAGGQVVRRNGVDAEITVATYPRPVQDELPMWVTSSRNKDTFVLAGEMGTGILTHLIGHTTDELKEKIAAYREAWSKSGRSGRGHVALMVHTFVGTSSLDIKEMVREPLKNYIRSSYDLMAGLGLARGVEMKDLPAEEIDQLLDLGFERFFSTSGLLGSVEDVSLMMDKIERIGVDEVGCLIDFGVPEAEVLASLRHLKSAEALYVRTRDQNISKQARAPSLPELMLKHDVTHIQSTPSLAAMLLSDRHTQEVLPNVQRFLVGGEALPPSLAEQLVDKVGGTVHNMYGPTEATVWATSGNVRAGSPPTIGIPLPGYCTFVVDERLQVVPIGIPGELLLGGDAIADGYHKRPDLTKTRFVPDRLTKDSDGYLYRTGDLVRWNSAGELEFLGRIDHQVKLRGRRIELGEIESALCRHKMVKSAVCDLRGDGDGRRIVAYCQAETGGTIASETDILAFLRGFLPEYMVPIDLHWMTQWPMTPNGKIDRKALPDKPRALAAAPQYEPPISDLEAKIAEIWKKVLKIESVGRTDNFFYSGGNSVLVVAVRTLLLDHVGDVSIVDLFRYPTIATLAAALGSRDASGSVVSGTASRAQQLAQRRLAARS